MALRVVDKKRKQPQKQQNQKQHRNGVSVKSMREAKTLKNDAFDWGEASVNSSDEESLSEDENNDQKEDREGRTEETDGEEDVEIENAQEKRVRLAKEYLHKLHESTHDDDEDEMALKASPDGVVGDKIALQLEKDALEQSGKMYKRVAQSLQEFEFDENSSKLLRGHKLSVTTVCIAQDEASIFSGAKDGSIIRWDTESGKKIRLHLPKEDEEDGASTGRSSNDAQKRVLALAVSSDNRYLASGGGDHLVRVWDMRSNSLVESFKGHRDVVSSLAFKRNSHMLFSASFDRTIKHWNLTEMGYVETLFGHQSEINSLDALNKDRVLSCGRDRTLRVWKIPEETQLVFNSSTSSIDCARYVNDQNFISGSDDGSLSLWNIGRKKPVFTLEQAHGYQHWIASLSCFHTTDLVATGSNDGFLRLWEADVVDKKALSSVANIPLPGFINEVAFAPSGRFIVAGVGQEHRLGRWQRLSSAKNGVALIALPELTERLDSVAAVSMEDKHTEE